VPYVCSAREKLVIERMERQSLEQRRLAKLMFSAKEAVFKCQFPVTHRYLEFSDVEVVLYPEQSSFLAYISSPDSHLAALRGRYLVTEDLILTGALLPIA
jgi:4'-phosphopantetheinyl transferase EntD